MRHLYNSSTRSLYAQVAAMMMLNDAMIDMCAPRNRDTWSILYDAWREIAAEFSERWIVKGYHCEDRSTDVPCSEDVGARRNSQPEPDGDGIHHRR